MWNFLFEKSAPSSCKSTVTEAFEIAGKGCLIRTSTTHWDEDSTTTACSESTILIEGVTYEQLKNDVERNT